MKDSDVGRLFWLLGYCVCGVYGLQSYIDWVVREESFSREQDWSGLGFISLSVMENMDTWRDPRSCQINPFTPRDCFGTLNTLTSKDFQYLQMVPSSTQQEGKILVFLQRKFLFSRIPKLPTAETD